VTTKDWLKQTPAPGQPILKFRGDTQTFTLTLGEPRRGSAWLRTNIGHTAIAHREIIRSVHHGEAPLGRDWFDAPMVQIDGRHFQVTLPLCEVGHFEAKCFFLSEDQSLPFWPLGANTAVNVEPADTCCANIIYNAFVRQFGPNKSGRFEPPRADIVALDEAGYAVIPPSGTFRDLIRELDFIVGELGCRIIQLLPIHPTPTTYGRMGRFGSPYAALSFTAVDPALAEFDSAATPLEQFLELVDAVHYRNAKIIIDIAINHTGWAAGLHESHPRWLARSSEGEIEVPSAWGVRWEDLTKLDYASKDLWQYMANVFLTWCRRGVDGFRCDAGYMIPVATWQYIVARVREQFPNTIFHLEGLGGKISVTRDLLNRANFNWAYSELFQNYDRDQIEHYLPDAFKISDREGLLVHFAETHDNLRLASRSQTYARMRSALCALFSQQGAFGFANGVEWFAAEKINVHESPSLNWGAATNQVSHIQRLNALLREHPAFSDNTELKLVQTGQGNHVVLSRQHPSSGKSLLIVVNLDDKHPVDASWRAAAAETSEPLFFDLLGENTVTAARSGSQLTAHLQAGQALCLTRDSSELVPVQRAPAHFLEKPQRALQQLLCAKALDVWRYYNGIQDLSSSFEPKKAANQLKQNPIEFCRQCNPYSSESRIITWRWPHDGRRQVMVPPEHFLLILSDVAFHARITDNSRTVGYEESLPTAGGTFFALFDPLPKFQTHRPHTLKIRIHEPDGTRHIDAPLLFLADPEKLAVKTGFRRSQLTDQFHLLLATNGRGAMLRAGVSFGELKSRYDALLAANLNQRYPEDRWIMFTRCRAWLVYQGYSQQIGDDCLVSFTYDLDGGGSWQFHIPAGQGQSVFLTLKIEMIRGKNAVRLHFWRQPAGSDQRRLSDHIPVQLILRPDIENRNFHQTTKAFLGPEHDWPAAVQAAADRFTFAPDDGHGLTIAASVGEFVLEPEWQYMVHRPAEAARGQDSDSDLFSPGYFSMFLEGNRQAFLTATVDVHPVHSPGARAQSSLPEDQACVKGTAAVKPVDALKAALNHFVVRRGNLKSVIAGYPWFLDWGRDSLIFVRGLIAAGRREDARAILQQFGQFEKDGTIPNMIQGLDAGNRDTSDAPLWFFLACQELVSAEKNTAFLNTAWGMRTIRDVLLSIGGSMIQGTANGIHMDPDSALVFSPAHYTWMDTDHPTGTPREGYPIEIQALWYAALRFLARIDPSENKNRWQDLAHQVRSSIIRLYFGASRGYLSDCLHARAGVPANQAEADDALRPNQLLALTLGAVTDRHICTSVLAACEALLIPGAIRSLGDRGVERPLPIYHNGKVINDPHHPYQGTYVGDEDTRRKPAYHNGTGWTWIFPAYCEAWASVYGKPARSTALAWLGSGVGLINQGCLGHVPEILDGDYPHTPRGCDAQAWGASELLRVWLKLSGPE
jgi:predicted glycogen debranching enzyme